MSAASPSLSGVTSAECLSIREYLDVVGPELRDVLGLSTSASSEASGSLSEVLLPPFESPQLSFPEQPRLEMIASRSVMVVGPTGVGKSTLGASLLASFPGQRGWIMTSRQAMRFSRWSPLLAALRADPLHPLIELQVDQPSRRSSEPTLSVGMFVAESAAQDAFPSPNTTTRRVEMMRTIRGWIDRLRGDRGNKEPTMVVIDDWGSLVNLLLDDPVASSTTSATRSAVAQLIASSLTEEGLQVVLLTEEGEDLRMGSVIDTYATLSFQEVGGRQVRTLELRGRGSRFSEPRLPFLVADSRVTLPPAFPGNAFGWDYDPSAPASTSEGLWPGSSDLTKLMGRIARRSLTYIEYEPGVPTDALVAMVSGIGVSACLAGGACLSLAPPEAVAPMLERASAESRLHPRLFKDMRFFSLDLGEVPETSESRKFLLPFAVPRSGTGAVPNAETASWLAGLSPTAPKVALISTEGYLAMAEALGGPTNLVAASRAASLQLQAGWSVVVTCSTENMARNPTSLPVDRRIHLFMDEGRLFAYGTQPRTPLWSLSARPSDHHSSDLHLVVELAA